MRSAPCTIAVYTPNIAYVEYDSHRPLVLSWSSLYPVSSIPTYINSTWLILPSWFWNGMWKSLKSLTRSTASLYQFTSASDHELKLLTLKVFSELKLTWNREIQDELTWLMSLQKFPWLDSLLQKILRWLGLTRRHDVNTAVNLPDQQRECT